MKFLFTFFFTTVLLISSNALGQFTAKGPTKIELAITQTYTKYNPDYQRLFAQNVREIKQDTSRTVLIETRDGNEFVGELVNESSTEVRIRTENYGEITILKAIIRTMKFLKEENIIGGVLWKEHMQSTRYFWQPSGYGLKKGEAYYQNVWIFFNQFSVGVTDHLLLGGGIMPLFLLGGSPTPVWITPKVSFPVVKDKVNVGVGGLFATVIGEEGLNLGIAYGSATFGSRDRNFTFGVGYGYSGGDWASRPVFSANFLSRVGARGYFIMENYIIEIDSRYGVLSMIGGRSIIGNNAGLDYGLLFPFYPEMDVFFAVPWLGITIPISNRGKI